VSTFAFSVATTLPPERAFDVATDWSAHSRIPFTHVTILDDTGGVGTRFTGRTQLGPLGFDDPMEVLEWERPGEKGDGHCYLVKQGNVVHGDASIDVRPGDGAGSVIHWRETATVGPRWLSAVVGLGIRLGGPLVFGWVLRSALRQAERAETGRGEIGRAGD
jgi:hypothetical protein